MSSSGNHPKPFADTSTTGRPRHWSVGALIERPADGAFLVIDRASAPFGLAGPAGHVDEGEERDLEGAIIREVFEEVGVMPLVQTELPDLWKVEVPWNSCRTVGVHLWHMFRVTLRHGAEPKFDPRETRGGGWYTPEQLAEATSSPCGASGSSGSASCRGSPA